MAPSRRSRMTHDLRLRGLSLVPEPMHAIDTSDLNAAAYLLQNQNAGFHHGTRRNDPAAAYLLQNQNTGFHHGTRRNNQVLPLVPDELAIQSSEINGVSCFQLASQAIVERNTAPNRVDYAPSATDGLMGLIDEDTCPEIFQLPELEPLTSADMCPEIFQLPELEPLTSAEESDMLLQILTHEQRQFMENGIYLPSSQQLTAPFNSFLSSQPCAIQHPPMSNSTIVAPVFSADIVQAAPTANTLLFPMAEEPSTFDVQMVQPPANNALPTSDPYFDRSTNSAVLNHVAGEVEGEAATSNYRARRVAITTGGRRRHHVVPAPTTTGMTVVERARRNPADVMLSKVVSQRQNHVRSERQRRTTMNEMFTSMRSLLPPQTQSDKASVVMEMINYIGRLQNELARLERLKSLKRPEGIQEASGRSDSQCTATGSQ